VSRETEGAPDTSHPDPIVSPQAYVVGGPETLPSIAPVPRDPVWTGWDVLLIAALAVIAMATVEVLTVKVAQVFIYPHVSFVQLAQQPMLGLLGEFFGYIPVFLLIVALVEGKYHVPFWQAIHWNWARWGWAMFGLGVLLLLSIDLLARFLPMPKSTPFDQFFASPRDAYLVSIFAVTLGPFMEELFFRGLLYPVLARRLGVCWGVLLTAAPFAMMHMFQYGYAWGVVLLIFIMGIVVTIVRAKTGSVAASFLVHVGYNATQMLALLLATDGFRHMEKAALG